MLQVPGELCGLKCGVSPQHNAGHISSWDIMGIAKGSNPPPNATLLPWQKFEARKTKLV